MKPRKMVGKMWPEHYGRPRATKRPREHKGIPQLHIRQAGSLAEYLRVHEAISKSLNSLAGELLPQRGDLGGVEDLTERQVREIELIELNVASVVSKKKLIGYSFRHGNRHCYHIQQRY